jgi:hypothetical protein
MADPPSAPAVNATVNVPSPVLIVSIVGAAGAVGAGVAVMAFDAAESPTELTALMVTGYDVPFVRPVMVNGLTVDAGERAM